MRLFVKKSGFFEMFEKVSENVQKGAALLVQLMQDLEHMDIITKEIQDVEKDGDIMTHDIIKRLNKTSLPFIDKKDLYDLASRLDDVIDRIWASADRFCLFSLKETTKEAVSMAMDILKTTEVIHLAIKMLKDKKYSIVQEYCVEINRLENKIDLTYRNALAKLFDESKDAIYIIKWKEIYEHLEEASDRCEDVANVLETIIIKYG